MYLLAFCQDENEIKVALFNSIKEGREFLEKIPGYKFEKDEFGFVYETFSPWELPDYGEIECNKNIFPLTKFSFNEIQDVEICWYEIPNLSADGCGLVDGITKVDAYMIDNAELKEYITRREEKYKKVEAFLESKGYEVSRNFAGSEDGEAIAYKDEDGDWNFLMHMDPDFVDEEFSEEEIEELLLD